MPGVLYQPANQMGNGWIKRAVGLAHSSQLCQSEERCIIGGHHIVSEYLRKGRQVIMLGVSKEYLKRHPTGPNGIIGDQSIPTLKILPDRAFNLITKEASPEGIIAEIPLPRSRSISNDRVLVLFNLSLPNNVGALIRSAVAFGWSILIVEKCTDPFSYSAIRSSMGTVLEATIKRVKLKDLNDILLINKLLPILATNNQEDLIKSSSTMSGIPSERIALILGNETLGFTGFDTEIIRSSITMTIDTGKVESLNVAVAGSILMHTLRRVI